MVSASANQQDLNRPGISGGSNIGDDGAMKKASKYSPEVIERAVRMVSESASQHQSQWAAITSIAAKIGYTPETLRRWVRQHEIDSGKRDGVTTDEQ